METVGGGGGGTASATADPGHTALRAGTGSAVAGAVGASEIPRCDESDPWNTNYPDDYGLVDHIVYTVAADSDPLPELENEESENDDATIVRNEIERELAKLTEEREVHIQRLNNTNDGNEIGLLSHIIGYYDQSIADLRGHLEAKDDEPAESEESEDDEPAESEESEDSYALGCMPVRKIDGKRFEIGTEFLRFWTGPSCGVAALVEQNERGFYQALGMYEFTNDLNTFTVANPHEMSCWVWRYADSHHCEGLRSFDTEAERDRYVDGDTKVPLESFIDLWFDTHDQELEVPSEHDLEPENEDSENDEPENEDDNEPPMYVPRPIRDMECIICKDDDEVAEMFLPCGHGVCLLCWPNVGTQPEGRCPCRCDPPSGMSHAWYLCKDVYQWHLAAQLDVDEPVWIEAQSEPPIYEVKDYEQVQAGEVVEMEAAVGGGTASAAADPGHTALRAGPESAVAGAVGADEEDWDLNMIRAMDEAGTASADTAPALAVRSFDDMVAELETVSYDNEGDTAADATADDCHILLKNLHGQTKCLTVQSDNLVEMLKGQVQCLEGIPPSKQRLIFEGQPLEDGNRLSDYNTRKESVVHLMMGLAGGVKKKIDKATEISDRKKRMTDAMGSVQEVVKNMNSVRTVEANITTFLQTLEQSPLMAFKQLAKSRTRAEIDQVLQLIKRECGGTTEDKLGKAAIVLMRATEVQNQIENLVHVLESCRAALSYGFANANSDGSFNLGSLTLLLKSVYDDLDDVAM